MSSITKRGTANVLRKAARLIDDYGWLRNSYGDKKHGFCAVGAIYAASPPRRDSLQGEIAKDLCADVIGEKFLSHWNDYKATGGAEVAKLFRKTARLLEHGMELPKA